MQIGAAEVAAVDEKELVAERLLRRFGTANETMDPDQGGIGLDVHHLPYHGGAKEVHNPELERFGRLQDMDVPFVVDQGEPDLRPGEGHPLELFHDVAEFHGVALQEFPAGRDVVEQVPDGEI